MKLSVVVPAYNEEENIRDVISKIESALTFPHELIVVNDHSADKTGQIARSISGQYKNIKVVENALNRGFANALKTGFCASSGEMVIPVMADLCDDLSTIKAMLDKSEQGYDIICGCRYMKGGARLGGSKIKGFFSSFVGGSLRCLLGIPTRDIANAFKMYRKTVLDKINIEAKSFEISMEITLKAFYSGFKIAELPTSWRERVKGKSSFKMFKLLPNYFRLYIWAISKKIA
jgi:dolichol-phosphate mannosyltransferase